MGTSVLRGRHIQKQRVPGRLTTLAQSGQGWEEQGGTVTEVEQRAMTEVKEMMKIWESGITFSIDL